MLLLALARQRRVGRQCPLASDPRRYPQTNLFKVGNEPLLNKLLALSKGPLLYWILGWVSLPTVPLTAIP